MNKQLSDKRRDAIDIFQAGLQAVAPGAAIKTFCQLSGEVFTVDGQNYDLSQFNNIFVLVQEKLVHQWPKQ